MSTDLNSICTGLLTQFNDIDNDEESQHVINETIAFDIVDKYIATIMTCQEGLVQHYFGFIDLMTEIDCIELTDIIRADIAYKLLDCFESKCNTLADSYFLEAVSYYLKCLDPDILPDFEYCAIPINTSPGTPKTLINKEATFIITKFIVDVRSVTNKSPYNTEIMTLVIRLFIYIKRLLTREYYFTEEKKLLYIGLICDTFEQQGACTNVMQLQELLYIAVMEKERGKEH